VVEFCQGQPPNLRVGIIVTEPLTNNETWTHFAPGELKLFVDGLPQQ
jgi:glutamine amidotransferase